VPDVPEDTGTPFAKSIVSATNSPAIATFVEIATFAPIISIWSDDLIVDVMKKSQYYIFIIKKKIGPSGPIFKQL
jgi:hypothetical protein